MAQRTKQRNGTKEGLVPIRHADRGPALFFHGRDKELRAFGFALKDAVSDQGGSTFVVQGPPGAGKTALLHECAKRAIAQEWQVVQISRHALFRPETLAEQLGKPYLKRVTDYSKGGGTVGVEAGIKLSISGGAGVSREYAGDSIQKLLQAAAQDTGLLLILDEVQNLEFSGKESQNVHDAISDCLEWIHNGQLGAPVILLMGGLGITERVLGEFGISRFMKYGLHELGRLDDESTQNVIGDWLVKSGGAPEDHKHLGHWIGALAERSSNWPQHIQLYAETAASWLLENESEPTARVPEIIWSQGRKEKEDYYRGRTSFLDLDDAVLLANLLQGKGENPHFTKKELTANFIEDRSPEQAAKMFHALLHQGVVARNVNKYYSVPIPSMRSWLVRQFADSAPMLSPTSRTEYLVPHRDSKEQPNGTRPT